MSSPDKSNKPKALTTAEVMVRLRARYADGGYAFLTEVGDATGAKQRRWADALVMSLWPSRGLELHGFEIKVSRGDWLKELKSPEKAEPVCRFCDRWWIVAGSKGIVDINELPKAWGLIEPDETGLKVRKQGPLLSPVPLNRAFIAAICRRACEQSVDNAVICAAVEAERERVAKLDRERQQREAKRLKDNLDPVGHITAKLQEFIDASGVDPFDYHGPKRIGEAVKIVLEHNGNVPPPLVNQMRQILDSAKRVVAICEKRLPQETAP